MYSTITKRSSAKLGISSLMAILALLSISTTALARDKADTVNNDVAVPAFQAGEATKALGVSEATADGSTLLIWGAAAAGGYYVYDESTKTADADSSANGSSTSSGSTSGTTKTLNCNYVNSNEDYQVWSLCQLACSYVGYSETNRSKTCSIVAGYGSGQKCNFNGTNVCN